MPKWEAGKEKIKPSVVHCGTATKETDMVVRSCRMSPERLDGRVDCRDTVIHLTALSHLLLSYWFKSKELTPVNFEDCWGIWGSSLSIGDVYGASVGYFYHRKTYIFAKVAPGRKQEK